jgi:hypothetical protein
MQALTVDMAEKLLVKSLGATKKEAKATVKSVIHESKNQTRAKQYDLEYRRLNAFEKANKGYEDYILYVHEIFATGLGDQAALFVDSVKKRYQNFADYAVEFDKNFVKEDDNNALLNELYAPRNVDLLMQACPELEDRLLSQKKDFEQRLYQHIKQRDPELALTWLVDHKKPRIKAQKSALADAMKSVLGDKSTLSEETPIGDFLSRKGASIVSSDGVEKLDATAVNALYMRKVVTPLGSLPAKRIMRETLARVEELSPMMARMTEKTALSPPAKTRKGLLGRLDKYKGHLMASVVATMMIFSSANLQVQDGLSSLIGLVKHNQQASVELQLEKAGEYKVKLGDSLFSIVRHQLGDKKNNETAVANEVQRLVALNPELKGDPNALKVGQRLSR